MASSLLILVTYVLCARISAEFQGPDTQSNPKDDGSDDKEKAKLRFAIYREYSKLSLDYTWLKKKVKFLSSTACRWTSRQRKVYIRYFYYYDVWRWKAWVYFKRIIEFLKQDRFDNFSPRRNVSLYTCVLKTIEQNSP